MGISQTIHESMSNGRDDGQKMSARSREYEQGRKSAAERYGQTYAAAEQSLQHRLTTTTAKPPVQRTFTPMYAKGKPVDNYQLGG